VGENRYFSRNEKSRNPISEKQLVRTMITTVHVANGSLMTMIVYTENFNCFQWEL
jgi:hypothetical protein